MNNRNKGAAGERAFCRDLGTLINIPWLRRNLDQTREGGYDILTTPPDDTCPTPAQEQLLNTLNTLAIEVKRTRQITPAKIRNWWQQAQTQADRCCPPRRAVLAIRQDRCPWITLVKQPIGLTAFGLDTFAHWLQCPDHR